jgi:hypothetical protein
MSTIVKTRVKRRILTPTEEKEIFKIRKKKKPLPKMDGRELVEDPFNLN